MGTEGTRGRGRVLGSRRTLAAGLASYLDASLLVTVAVALPVWTRHHGLTLWEVGLLTSGLGFAFALGAAVGGRLADRFGRERLFTSDLLVFVVGVVVALLAPGSEALLVGVVVAGLAAGADLPTSLAVVASSNPPSARGGPVGATQLLWSAGIVVTFTLAFALSGLGRLGTQLLLVHLLGAAVVTLLLRLRLPPPPVTIEAARRVTRAARPERRLVGPLVATGSFYLLWNVAATTVGTYGTYFLVTHVGLTQTQATAAVVFTIPPVVCGLLFVRLADTPWRDRLFPVAATLQVAGFVVAAATGADRAVEVAVLLALFSVSNVFGGEAVYRVWSQQLLAPSRRAADFGLTYGLGRVVASTFLLAVPFLIDQHPGVLLWALAGCVSASGLLGVLIVVRARPALRPAAQRQ